MRRINQTFKVDELNRLCKIEKVSTCVNEFNGFQYDFIELSPDVFHVIRKIQGIDEALIKQIFSMMNLDNLRVVATPNKDGTFYVFPSQGGVILKSISRVSYKKMMEFIPSYFRNIMMSPNSLIAPILGVFQLRVFNLEQKTFQFPIYFILKKSVENFSYNDLSNEDLVFGFDIKGQIKGRKHLENPRQILNFEHVQSSDQRQIYRQLKDQDFLQSFKKLDITKSQAEKISAQLKTDVELLCQNGFMDYSLFMIIVIKPFKEVDFKKNYIKTLKDFEASEGEPSNRNRLTIAQIDPELL